MELSDQLTQLDISNKSDRLKYAHPGLYFLLRQGEVVYVGQSTTNILSRLAYHLLDKTFDSVTIIECAPGPKLDYLEAQYIWQFEPEYNCNIPPNQFFFRKSLMAKVLRISGRTLNGLLKRHEIHGRVNGYYDIREIKPLLGDRK